MALRKTCIRNIPGGFSLIEVLVVLSIVATIAGLSAFFSLSDYRAVSFRSERDAIVGNLQQAREESMHGTCTGVCVGPTAHSVHIQTSAAVTLSGFTDVVFEALSGRATASPGNTLTITDVSGRSSVITVGSEGRISWTN